MAIIMGKGCLEAIYGLMGWKGLKTQFSDYVCILSEHCFPIVYIIIRDKLKLYNRI